MLLLYHIIHLHLHLHYILHFVVYLCQPQRKISEPSIGIGLPAPMNVSVTLTLEAVTMKILSVRLRTIVCLGRFFLIFLAIQDQMHNVSSLDAIGLIKLLRPSMIAILCQA